MTSAFAAICSAKGCRVPAEWVLVWNNPRIHSPEREKLWVACASHRTYLEEFLDARGFLRRVEAVRNRDTTRPDPPGPTEV